MELAFEKDVELMFRIFNVNKILNELYEYIPFHIFPYYLSHNQEYDEVPINDINNINYQRYILYIDIDELINKSTNNNHIEFLYNLKQQKKGVFKYSLGTLLRCKPFYTNIYNLFKETRTYFPNILFDKYKNYITNDVYKIEEEISYTYDKYYKKRVIVDYDIYS